MPSHFHKYRRRNIAARGKPEHWVMQCSLAGCSHYMHMASKLSAPLLMDKISICNKCNEPFAMNRRAIRMAEPTCDDCVAGRIITKDKVQSIDDFFKGLENRIEK